MVPWGKATLVPRGHQLKRLVGIAAKILQMRSHLEGLSVAALAFGRYWGIGCEPCLSALRGALRLDAGESLS